MEAGMKFRGKTKLWAGRAVLYSPALAMVLYLAWRDPKYGLYLILGTAGVLVLFKIYYIAACWISEGKDEAEDDQ
jgi:hypothetical protein